MNVVILDTGCANLNSVLNKNLLKINIMLGL